MCWVEGPPEFDSVAACRDGACARRRFAARVRFSRLARRFRNCIGLNLSFPWTPDAEARLKVIGELMAAMHSEAAAAAMPRQCGPTVRPSASRAPSASASSFAHMIEG